MSEIQDYAFSCCYNLKNVIFHEQLTSIGKYAFFKCESINKIQLPPEIKEIQKGTFSHCKALKELIIPSTLEVIHSYAFQKCHQLYFMTYRKVSSNIKTLYIIDLPYTLSKIGDYAFAECESIKRIIIPNILKKIDTELQPIQKANITKQRSNDSFTQKSDSRRVKILQNEKFIQEQTHHKTATSGPSSPIALIKMKPQTNPKKTITPLNQINVNKANIQSSFSVNSIELDEAIKKSNGLLTIGSSSFYKCTSIEAIEIPPSVKEIKMCAFTRCTGMKDVIIHSRINAIEKNLFNRCYSLESFKIPKTVKIIKEGAFAHCHEMKWINILFKVESIESRAFLDCKSLTLISIPTFIKEINRHKVKNSELIQSLFTKEINRMVFLGCSSLKEVSIPLPINITATMISNCCFNYIYLQI